MGTRRRVQSQDRAASLTLTLTLTLWQGSEPAAAAALPSSIDGGAAGPQRAEAAAADAAGTAGAAGAEAEAGGAGAALAYRDEDGRGSEVRVLSGIERGLRSASLSFNTTLAWRPGQG